MHSPTLITRPTRAGSSVDLVSAALTWPAVRDQDPANGAVIWEKRNKKNQPWGHLGSGAGWSHEEALVVIGDSLLVGMPGANQTELVALDPTDGRERWRKERARSFHASPAFILPLKPVPGIAPPTDG